MVALTDVGTLLGESMFLGMSHVAEAEAFGIGHVETQSMKGPG